MWAIGMLALLICLLKMSPCPPSKISCHWVLKSLLMVWKMHALKWSDRKLDGHTHSLSSANLKATNSPSEEMAPSSNPVRIQGHIDNIYHTFHLSVFMTTQLYPKSWCHDKARLGKEWLGTGRGQHYLSLSRGRSGLWRAVAVLARCRCTPPRQLPSVHPRVSESHCSQTPPGGGWKEADWRSCTTWWSNMDSQSHGNGYMCPALQLQWCFSSVWCLQALERHKETLENNLRAHLMEGNGHTFPLVKTNSF